MRVIPYSVYQRLIHVYVSLACWLNDEDAVLCFCQTTEVSRESGVKFEACYIFTINCQELQFMWWYVCLAPAKGDYRW